MLASSLVFITLFNLGSALDENSLAEQLKYHLTEKGYEKLEQALPVAREIANQVMASMSERSLNSMTKTLSMVRKNAHNGLDELTNKNKKRKKSA